MGMLWPAFRYHLTASSANARWDVHVNGPLSRSEAAAVARAAAEDGRSVAFANRGAIRTLLSRSRVLTNAGDLYAMRPSGKPDYGLAWAPPALVLKGAMSGPHAAGIDSVSARRLGIRIGDRVCLKQVYAGPSGRLATQVTTVTVSAILATTVDLRGVVIRSPEPLQRALERSVGIVATDAFVRTDDPVDCFDDSVALLDPVTGPSMTSTWQRRSTAI
jgi:hypothetical protein